MEAKLNDQATPTAGRFRQPALLLSAVLGGGVALLLAADFVAVMSFFDHNEHMYVTAGYLVNRGERLYQGFAFLQMPYLPLVYALAFRLTDASHYLLVGKIVSFLFLIGSALILFAVTQHLAGKPFLSLGVAALFLLSSTTVRVAAETSNYIMPVAFSYLAFLVFIRSVSEERIRTPGVVLAGAAISIAVGAKLYYAAAYLPFLVAGVCFPRSAPFGRRLRHVVLPFSLGAAVGLLPAAWFFLQAPQAFLFNNYSYHALNAERILRLGYANRMFLETKLLYARNILYRPENWALILGVALTAWGLLLDATPGQVRRAARAVPMELALALLLLIVSLPAALSPTPSFQQYFAMPLSFLFLLFACLMAMATRSHEQMVTGIMLLCLVLTLLVRLPILVNTPAMADADAWPGVRFHRQAAALRRELEEAKIEGKVATLSPLYAVEADLPIYREFAAGPFLYRVGDLIPPADRSRFTAASAGDVAALFDGEPPAAILVGFEKALDDALREYAEDNGYRIAGGDRDGGTLYLRQP